MKKSPVKNYQLELQENLNQAKTEFLSAVSHEVRTPLAIVEQLLGILYDETAGTVNDRQREILIKARGNINRLKGIVNKLLDISRIENKQLKLRYSLVNLNDLFRESEDFFKASAKEKNIRLDYRLPQPGAKLFIDAERIIQVITNLIQNAIKFTPSGGKVSVEVEMVGNKVRVGVIDSGVGIARKNLSKVFGKFIQLPSVPRSEHQGIGLGLSIARELVEKHGGEIWVESKPNAGSRFYFTLPLFHSMRVLELPVKQQINRLLGERKIVYLVNVLIFNFD